ncbi:hypothetical protein BN946_scf184806.g2 [Trametes cinnabarina]|uniref:Uncharacterized protein n=1 Tax=Pycnoporus cinnabarinus TaxID=5643 RepID=A0A060S6T0_PYCCI|nr:hypothetical protein BN946_scf184806.g2 [Trametes cinnabarina]
MAASAAYYWMRDFPSAEVDYRIIWEDAPLRQYSLRYVFAHELVIAAARVKLGLWDSLPTLIPLTDSTTARNYAASRHHRRRGDEPHDKPPRVGLLAASDSATGRA